MKSWECHKFCVKRKVSVDKNLNTIFVNFKLHKDIILEVYIVKLSTYSIINIEISSFLYEKINNKNIHEINVTRK